jgi:exodeoxyribonuclease-3
MHAAARRIMVYWNDPGRPLWERPAKRGITGGGCIIRFVSWNVNGLRACLNKGFMDQFNKLDADFFCVQETKLQAGQIDLDLPGYTQTWNYAERKGYSGTAVFAREEPLSASPGIGIAEHDREGRVITLEYGGFYLVNAYVPNAQPGLVRLEYRMRWDEAFREYICSLDAKKPVVVCGDMNVAHTEMDIKNPKANRTNPGFTDEEREGFTRLVESGFIDTFRRMYPERRDAYSWWTYRFKARERNVGWRIDYFLVSNRLWDGVSDAVIHSDIYGSDHCPVGLGLD